MHRALTLVLAFVALGTLGACGSLRDRSDRWDDRRDDARDHFRAGRGTWDPNGRVDANDRDGKDRDRDGYDQDWR